MNIVCSGYIVRYPLAGQTWHHLQYLLGFARLGHRVTFVEESGWPRSCYDPSRGEMTDDPAYGVAYLAQILRAHGLADDWCYVAADGTAHGLSRAALAVRCREADLYVDLSGMNRSAEVEACRTKVLIDTDPVFTQIGGHRLRSLEWYDALFTFGENVHRPECSMPIGDARWRPTRQPIVLDQWPAAPGDAHAPFTTVMNFNAYGERTHAGRVYGQKDRSFAPFVTLPRQVGEPMEIALNAAPDVCRRLELGGWRLADPLVVTQTPEAYRRYLVGSRAEFSVAKEAYVVTRSGWFSERSAAYLACGRPVIVQDTGFGTVLPVGRGVLAFATPAEAADAIARLRDDYVAHCRAARAVAEEFFDARTLLGALLEASLAECVR